MKILFATFYDPAYLGIRYLGANLVRAGHEVRILQLKSFRSKLLSAADMSAHTGYHLYYRQAFSASGDSEFPITPVEMDLFEESIAEWQPDITGFTLRSPYNHLLPTLLPVMRRAAPRAFLLGGGYGPTFNPELPLHLGADAIVRGEGEGAMLDLAAALESGKDWRGIQNLAWLDREGALVQNRLRPLIRDLDAQPFPLYAGDHFVSIEDDTRSADDMRLRTTEGIFCQSYAILSARGCIGHCSYCSGGNWRNQYKLEGHKAPLLRCRSLPNVMEELRHAKRMGETTISFVDEYFVRPYDELCAFFEQYAEEIDLPFYAHFHRGQLMEERDGRKKLLEIVRRAGLTEIPVGVQSANEAFAARVYNRQNKNEEILNAVSCFQKAGFSGNYHIIGANPLETDAEIEDLYKFCSRIPFDPSLKTRWDLLGHRLKLLDGTPLLMEHPELKQLPADPAKFTETMLLADLSNKVPPETFAAIRTDPFYTGHPERLQWLLLTTIRDRHQLYLAQEIARLEGKPVYFWGAGEMFQYKSPLFHKLRPQCLLDNTIPVEDSGKMCKNGLAVCHPDAVLPGGAVLPIVIFSVHVAEIYRTLLKRYPEFTDVVSCALP